MLKHFFSDQPQILKRITALTTILIVAIVGTILLTGSHASTPYVSLNADKGTLTSGATSQACSGASDGQCVQFGSSISGGGGNPACTQTLSPGADIGAAIGNASAGSVICLNSGNYTGSVDVRSSHATATAPITVTSTNPSSPAVIANETSVFYGANYVTFTRLTFDWAMPKPWACWGTDGNTISGQIISEPYSAGTCQAGTANPADHVQIAVDAAHTSFTYDDINSEGTNICMNMGNYGGRAQYTLIDHSRIHGCGPPMISGWGGSVNAQWGWHAHGIYDYGDFTTITNSYIYGSSRNGLLFYPSGTGAVAKNNVIDGNGNGVTFDGDTNVTVSNNIITNSTSPLGYADYGATVGSGGAGSGTALSNNCMGGNKSGDISVSGVTVSGNKTGINPLYVDAANHNYKLQAGSPCVGYGPDTAQP